MESNNKSLSKNEKIFGFGIAIIVIIFLIYAYKKGYSTRPLSKYEHLQANRTDCLKCSICKKGFKRPAKIARYGCDSSTCKCEPDFQALDTNNYILQCSTCPKCIEGQVRPNRLISTAKNIGCSDKRCNCR